MPNRLALEASLYLRQHADNPIDWFPWGEEAIAKAQREQKPIFLSVGYSSCHWCHVMAHESFEDDAVAAVINERFVAIKVDREERPDIDEAYMTAVQLQSGRGGWPMSVFLTPTLEPMLAGTYFSRDDRGGSPGFLNLARHIAELWETKRDDVLAFAKEFARQTREAMEREAPQPNDELGPEAVERLVAAHLEEFDATFGGFGPAPKFPPYGTLRLFLDLLDEPRIADEAREAARRMTLQTLTQMALGGVCDQVGGGLHRYSVDDRWRLPHFEKMLSDNALALGAYSRAARAFATDAPAASALFARTADQLVDWLLREMRGADGLFFASLDADANGREGSSYVWTVDEILSSLPTEGEAFLFAYQFEPEGNFRDEATGAATGENVPHLRSALDAASPGTLAKLLAIRNQRIQPQRDDKAIVGWNGLLIEAFVEAGRIDLATSTANAIWDRVSDPRQLPRYFVYGQGFGVAFADDIAYLALGLLALSQHGQGPWMERARQLADLLVERFGDESGGFWNTAEATALGRSKSVFDQPAPSVNGAALRALIQTGIGADRIAPSFRQALGWMERAPMATCELFRSALLWEGFGQERSSALSGVDIQAPAEAAADSDGWATIRLDFHVPEGFHVSGPQSEPAIALKVSVSDLVHQIDYPEDDGAGLTGDFAIEVAVRMSGKSAIEECSLELSYQVCDATSCLPIETQRFGVLLRAPGAPE